MTIAEDIIQRAKAYDGQKEIPPYNNSGFVNPDFQEALTKISGWVAPDPWCSAFNILVWDEAYTPYPKLHHKMRTMVSLNSQQMARNFHADPIWPTSTTTPKVGAMAQYGDGDSTVSGHSTVVIEVLPDGRFRTEEGNTRPDGNPGSMREGYIVAQHTHSVGLPHSHTGLNFIRFIYPVEPGSSESLKMGCE